MVVLLHICWHDTLHFASLLLVHVHSLLAKLGDVCDDKWQVQCGQ